MNRFWFFPLVFGTQLGLVIGKTAEIEITSIPILACHRIGKEDHRLLKIRQQKFYRQVFISVDHVLVCIEISQLVMHARNYEHPLLKINTAKVRNTMK